MKKILYATAIKALAVILFIACIASGVLVVTNGILRAKGEAHFIYQFENSFEESEYIQSLLEAPGYAIMEAYYTAYRVEHDSTPGSSPEPVTSEPETEAESCPQNGISASRREIPAGIAEELNHLYYGDKINYFVEWNGQIITNCHATSAAEVLYGDSISFYIQRSEDGGISTNGSPRYKDALDLFEYINRYDKTSAITVCVSIKDSYAAQCKALWERQAAIVTETAAVGGLLALGALLQLTYLVCVCGKNKNGEQKILWVDYIWSEIHLAMAVGAVIGGIALYIYILEEALYARFPAKFLYPLAGALAALAAAILLTSLLSVIRNVKARRGMNASLICTVIRLTLRGIWRILRGLGRICKAVGQGLVQLLSKKTGVLSLVMLVVYSLLLIFGVFAGHVHYDDELLRLWLVITVIAFALVCRALIRRAIDLDELRKGVAEMQSGNLSRRIPTPKSEELKPLADSINEIAEGLDKAVADKVKAERMKAELITNVSHDLKTPLTSIINYTELLAKVEGLPEEAQDYVEILSKKNLRLKNLTRDLFDISKVQSGNEEVVLEKLDVSLLIEQILGEQDSEIRASRLPLCVNTPKELFILADGRKMSRVVGNLLNNVLKYAMENTRVFITAAEADGQITLEFKNVSASPLDFDPEEIVGRFVRGDESRTTEGSGLGLAIAKSYTELCGGSLTVSPDGDLFKVLLSFPAYAPEV